MRKEHVGQGLVHCGKINPALPSALWNSPQQTLTPLHASVQLLEFRAQYMSLKLWIAIIVSYHSEIIIKIMSW